MTNKSLRAFAPMLAVCFLIIAAPASASPEKVGPPTSITALGDSITRGYNSQGSGCTAFSDCQEFSWATGGNAAVNSYYNRVKALNPTVVRSNPTAGNDAVTGAKMSALAEQATKAVKGNPDAVLIEMGANDVCTSSEATLTPVASFRSSLVAGLNVISTKTPDARIVINSIPNIFQLWNVLHKTTAAQLIWGLGKICQAMLAEPTSESAAAKTRRANVQKRNEEFNATLSEVCAEYIHCHYDGGAAFAVSFVASEVNTNDYFHPDVAGQTDLANTAFKNGPNYADATAPSTTITPDREPDGVEGWYDNNVKLTLSAAAAEFPVKGTEYKLGEAEAWTRYTGPITISSEGSTTISARSVDVNGDIEASKSTTIKIDKTAPTFTLTCPASPVTLGASAAATVSGASDALSGFTTEPNGETPLNTSTPGNGQTETVQVHDRAGNTTSHSCSYDVHYPDPGAPTLTSGVSPNADGLFTLAWSGSDPSLFGITYTLQHRNADTEEWSDVATSLSSLTFAFTGTGEEEGTWTYRVQGSDPSLGLTTAWSPTSSPVVVDKTPPTAPSASADRAPDYAGGGGWFKDSVTVSFTDNGDPALSDGSPGSGVNPSSIPAPQTFTTDGSHTAAGTVSDNVGNQSAEGSLTVQVDVSPPSLEITCPASALVGEEASATVLASDGQSGLASDPSGTVAIDTSKAGAKTITRTAIDNVGHETTESCTTQVEYPNPGAPSLSAGETPNATGLFTLTWSGLDPAVDPDISYTLQHRNAASAEWTTVASGISSLSYAFTGGGEAEGTWTYRVQGFDAALNRTTEWSPVSGAVVVDKTAPAAPIASPDRAPDYALGGGWYKDSVKVSFTVGGDPPLADGSPGTGLDPSTIPATQTFTTDGSHTAAATVSDKVGNQSEEGSATVQVDASPPALEVNCPAPVSIGAAGVSVEVVASDGQSGLAVDPSGAVPINTASGGVKTVTRTAIDNVGHETTASCSVLVGYTQVITTALKSKLVVKAGQAVELTSTAKASLGVSVKPGGVLDIEGATISGNLSASKAGLVRVCGATLSATVNITASTGSVVLGEGNAECPTDEFHGHVVVKANTAGVLIDEDVFAVTLKVTGNSGGATVTNNVIAGALNVTGNSGPVIDTPNEVEGKSKLQ